MQSASENHGTFGNRLFSVTRGGGGIIFRKIMYSLPALLVIGFIAYVYIDEFFLDGVILEESWERWIALLPLVLAIAGLLFVLLRLRFYSEVSVYGGGVVLKYRDQTQEFDFSKIKGVSGYRRSTTTAGFVPVWVSRTMEIVGPPDVTLAATRTPNLRALADALGAAFSSFITQDLTAENIDKLHTTFGKELELKDGKLVHRNKEPIPLERVADVQFTHGNHVNIVGDNAKGVKSTLISLNMEDMYNLGLLSDIVQKFGKPTPEAKHNIKN